MNAPTVSKDIDHLSASQMGLYLRCSLKYRFQYIDRLPKPFKPSALAFGSAVHSTLEWFNRKRINGNSVSLEEFIRVFEADWFTQTVETDIRYKNGENESALLLMGKQMLTQYFHTDQKMPINAEIPFSLPVINSVTGETLSTRIEGFIDLIEEGHVIVEYKTSARSLREQDLHDSLQLKCYVYAYELLFQARPRSFKVINLVKTRNPKISVVQTGKGTREPGRVFNIAKTIYRAIRSNIFVPNPNFMCKDCEYEQPCKSWNGNPG